MTGRKAPRRTPATTAAKSVRCAIYTRKSTEEGLEQEFNSLDAQREAAEAYIASQKHEGWTCLPDRYDDGGFSGGSMDRPALKRLLAEVEAGRVDAILVYKVDRLSRSLLDFSRIIGTLDEHGVSFVSVTQQFNTTTSMGRLTLNILLSFAQFERETIAERTRDKMSAARRKGKWTGGPPVLGYDVDPSGGRLLVNEAEAAQVREIFALYLEHESLLDAARDLNRRGIRTKSWTTRKGTERNGHPWDKTRLGAILRNRSYLGQVNHKGTVYPGEHPAIVDPKVWERVQRLLSRNGRSGGRATRNKHGALLRGLLWCTPCGAAMSHSYTQRGSRRYRYYVCSRAQKRGWDSCPTKSLPAGEVEKFVVDRIRGIGEDPKLITAVTNRLQAAIQVRADALRAEQKAIEKELTTCVAETKRTVGRRTGETPGQLADLQERMTAARERLATIRAEFAGLMVEVVCQDDVVAALKRFNGVWDVLAPREQARVIALLVERVAYDPEREAVAVTFRPGGIRALTTDGTG